MEQSRHFVAVVMPEGAYRGSVCDLQSCDHIGGITMDEARANARLIAAAPELLEALVAVERRIADDDGFDGTKEIIRAAIAKATGEQA